MFKLFSRSKQNEPARADFSRLGTDMHSHLIPGIDDGAPDVSTSLALIRGMVDLGFSKLITTPHVMWDMYKNTRDGILAGLDRLHKSVAQAGIVVEIHAGAEYFLDDHVSGLLKKNEPLLTISDKKVLVEFSLAHAPFSLKESLFELQMQGYQPVIAHPERYIYLEDSKEFFDELKELGCLFQLNLLSLTSYYGKTCQELAQYLIKKGYYNMAGTDLHHGRHLNALQAQGLSSQLNKLLDAGNLINSQL